MLAPPFRRKMGTKHGYQVEISGWKSGGGESERADGILGRGGFLVGQFECTSHRPASGRRIKLKEDVLDSGGFQATADAGHAGGGAVYARAAVQSQARTGLRSVFEQQLHWS